MHHEKEKIKKNPFQYFLDKEGLTLHGFSVEARIHHNSLYPIYRGERNPKRPLAVRLVKASNGKLKLEDFGFQ